MSHLACRLPTRPCPSLSHVACPPHRIPSHIVTIARQPYRSPKHSLRNVACLQKKANRFFFFHVLSIDTLYKAKTLLSSIQARGFGNSCAGPRFQRASVKSKTSSSSWAPLFCLNTCPLHEKRPFRPSPPSPAQPGPAQPTEHLCYPPCVHPVNATVIIAGLPRQAPIRSWKDFASRNQHVRISLTDEPPGRRPSQASKEPPPKSLAPSVRPASVLPRRHAAELSLCHLFSCTAPSEVAA